MKPRTHVPAGARAMAGKPAQKRRQAARRLEALPDLLLPREVLEVLRLESRRPSQTLRRLERRGLPVQRLSRTVLRVRRADLERFMAESGTTTKP